jgi:hypothetical protein
MRIASYGYATSPSTSMPHVLTPGDHHMPINRVRHQHSSGRLVRTGQGKTHQTSVSISAVIAIA